MIITLDVLMISFCFMSLWDESYEDLMATNSNIYDLLRYDAFKFPYGCMHLIMLAVAQKLNGNSWFIIFNEMVPNTEWNCIVIINQDCIRVC